MTKRKDPSELKERYRTPLIYSEEQKEEALKILLKNNMNFRQTARETGLALVTLHGFLNAKMLSLKARERIEELAKLEDEPIEQKRIRYERVVWDAKLVIVENILALAERSTDIVRLSQALRAIHWTTAEPTPDPGDTGGNNSETNILAIVTNQILQVKQNNQNGNPNRTKSNRAVRDRKKLARQSGG